MKRKPAKTKKPLLSHHRHTGKRLSYHHTSWPFVVLLLLMVGVIIGHTAYQVRAEDVTVTAAADGPLPPAPAVITSPQTGTTVTTSPITVSGTCPAPYVVKLYRNQAFSGSAQCQPDDTFSITTDLSVGRNELEARIFNFADQEGPPPTMVVVFYAPPSAPPTNESPAEPSADTGQPFLLTTDQDFKANQDSQRIEWTFGIIGGTPPYTVTVKWGDGTTSTIDSVTERSFTISHDYAIGPTGRDYYEILVTATDAADRRASLQVFAILNFTAVGTINQPALPGLTLPPFSSLSQTMPYIVSGYIAISLMALSFWLGQHVIAAGAIGHGWSPKFKLPHIHKPRT